MDFSKIVAIDTETYLISYPDQINPRGVCCAVSVVAEDGNIVSSVRPFDDSLKSDLKNYFIDPQVLIVGHNLAFDLHVIRAMFPELERYIWTGLSLGGFRDTLLREKLYMISTDGRADAKPCSLAHLSERWLDIKVEGKEDGWRFRYAELDGVPIEKWPQDAIDYARQDAEITAKVWVAQEAARQSRGRGSMNTEKLQVQSSYALRQLTLDGILTDQAAVDSLDDQLRTQWGSMTETLNDLGMMRDNGSRDMAKIREYLASRGVTETTEKGAISTSRATLEAALKANPDDMGLQALCDYSALQKGLNTFVPQMREDRIHPEFNTIVSTLRTSCRASNYHKYKGGEYGVRVKKRGQPLPSINFQQVPRDSRYRKVFKPEPGHVFVCADYSNLELVCAAQTYYELFGFSDMMQVLNTGVNLHDDMAAFNLGITLDEYLQQVADGNREYKTLRQQGKTITLGIPGGRGWRAIARERDIPEAEAERLFDRLRGRFRELQKFFGAHPGDPGWIGSRQAGQRYIDGDWITTFEGEGPMKVWLANKTYCQFANCLSMQMRGALGAKMALFNLVRATRTPGHLLYKCSVKALIHDEFLVSVPESRAAELREVICEIMCSSMQIITPNMRVGVEAAIQDHWDKGPTKGYDEIAYFLDPPCPVRQPIKIS